MRRLLNTTCILLLPQKHIKNKGYLLPDSKLTIDCDMSIKTVMCSSRKHS